MDKEKIKKEYYAFNAYYKQFQKEVFILLDKIKNKDEYKNIDIAEIKERPGNEIKSIESICENIARPDKYNNCNSLIDIKDVAGVRVICHCEDDLSALSEIIENILKEERYVDIQKEVKGGGNGTTANQKSRLSYRAIHITFAKKYQNNKKDIKVYCEIQLRTVMGDAWAVQDRKYIYGQNVAEGDRHILTDSVSEIMRGCEGLWSLVKKKYKNETNVDVGDFKIIKESIKDKTKALKQEDENSFDSDLKNDKL